jgi:pimeloyl-ACP methyl ester carboxylesterase
VYPLLRLTMRLEIITQRPKKNSGLTPLLFVHGACHGAWCWENFLPYFALHGYEAHALSLRGHGTSDGHERIRSIHTAEYVADVADAVGRLRAPPVLIGHSMGGYVIQKYLETHAAPAAVLMASIPVTGISKMLVRIAVRHPWLSLKSHATRSAYVMVETSDLARETLFSADLPAETLNRHFSRLQNESYRVGLEAALFNLPQPGRVRPLPMLVLGAANDMLFTRSEVEATAWTYKTQAEFFPNMAHDMMLDNDWMSVAERILKWLREQGL